MFDLSDLYFMSFIAEIGGAIMLPRKKYIINET